jgi:fatty-acyl-CoA synthase
MARAMLEHPDRGRRRLDSMRTGLTIGLAEDIEMTMEAVGARELCNVYGSTETYGNCAVTDAHDPLAWRLHTQGLPLPGMDIRVAEPETRQPLPTGEVGELCVAGHVTPGYFRAPELDAAAFDGEGYFHTGDLGLVGDDGRVRFRGRLKEMIKTGGINVAPLEVESVLLQHPGVKQAYVLELHEAAAADAGAIVAFCRERLASYKVPTRLVFRKAEELPRTPTGKIHKPGLREELM